MMRHQHANLLVITLLASAGCVSPSQQRDVAVAGAEGTLASLDTVYDVAARATDVIRAISAYRRDHGAWPEKTPHIRGVRLEGGQRAKLDELESIHLLRTSNDMLVVVFSLRPYETEVPSSSERVFVHEAEGLILMEPSGGGAAPEAQIAVTRLQARDGSGDMTIDLDTDGPDDVVRQILGRS